MSRSKPDEAKYAVLRAPLDDGRELVYRDVRRLGTILLLDEKGWAEYDAALGPEPLDPGAHPERDSPPSWRRRNRRSRKC